jgi:hypothetical protein
MLENNSVHYNMWFVKTLRLQFTTTVIDSLKKKYRVTLKKSWATLLQEPQLVFAFMLKEEEEEEEEEEDVSKTRALSPR